MKKNDVVNLERALTLEKRIDGHIVSGHIDCTATFVNSKNDGFSKEFFFRLPKEFAKYVIYKGSIAINGLSLTIASIKDEIILYLNKGSSYEKVEPRDDIYIKKHGLKIPNYAENYKEITGFEFKLFQISLFFN